MKRETALILMLLNVKPCFLSDYDCSKNNKSCSLGTTADFLCPEPNCGACNGDDIEWQCHVEYGDRSHRRCIQYSQCVHEVLDQTKCYWFLRRNERLHLVGMTDRINFASTVACMNSSYDWSSDNVITHTVHYYQLVRQSSKTWAEKRCELKLRNYGHNMIGSLQFQEPTPPPEITEFAYVYCTNDCFIMGYKHRDSEKLECMVWSWETNMTMLSLECHFLVDMYCQPLEMDKPHVYLATKCDLL